ncbi:MAG: phosphorylase [Acidobacteriia bacterium]|nr:phosphorylase [Terriglobia bacterium]
MPKVAVVAALEREVWPFVKDWPTTRREHDGRWFKFFEKEGMVLVCGGMGAEAARRAAEAIIALYAPGLVISAGFAGGLDPALPVGHTLTPRHVIDATDGSRTDSGTGEGVLISFETVADAEQKARFATAFGAHAVDMEAAAVARAAQAHGVKFLACKVISDTSDSRLPPIARFIGSDGRFHALQFLVHIAVRPWHWRGVRRLANDSLRAAQSLGISLEQHKRVLQENQESVLPALSGRDLK